MDTNEMTAAKVTSETETRKKGTGNFAVPTSAGGLAPGNMFEELKK
ncbi:MAG: hypothetical protein IJL55_07705 [Lachnospiraceae bacterium]|nr:hypothetical protein [Lachnospiraceae bacterium]